MPTFQPNGNIPGFDKEAAGGSAAARGTVTFRCIIVAPYLEMW